MCHILVEFDATLIPLRVPEVWELGGSRYDVGVVWQMAPLLRRSLQYGLWEIGEQQESSAVCEGNDRMRKTPQEESGVGVTSVPPAGWRQSAATVAQTTTVSSRIQSAGIWHFTLDFGAVYYCGVFERSSLSCIGDSSSLQPLTASSRHGWLSVRRLDWFWSTSPCARPWNVRLHFIVLLGAHPWLAYISR